MIIDKNRRKRIDEAKENISEDSLETFVRTMFSRLEDECKQQISIQDDDNAARKDWWIDTKIDQYDAFWGGEVASAKLNQKLKPEIITIYTNEPPGPLVMKGKLKKNLQGEVEILNKFWNVEVNNNLVHPILIYADLIASGDE